ncbi:Uncharacterised protein [Legionella beliardensis]|uniref:Uncharacterized protein n=1 Tax=Legionella beliardensis TaxID=91822 RepID=A0A378JRA4_9GAMM|nr:hypothetical protein [Legionella beliardensis]STX55731.1 Uncharacterised protein [Legionella beliardensis]
MIEGFRKKITCQKEITQGKHFNLQHLIAAYQAYIDNFHAFETWHNCDLFWQNVVGYVQRQMTAYDAQIHCSGIQKVLGDEKSFARRLEFANGGAVFPLNIDSGLGFDFAIHSYYAVGGEDCLLALAACWGLPAVTALKNYVEQKQTHLLDLESHLSKECIISQVNCT